LIRGADSLSPELRFHSHFGCEGVMTVVAAVFWRSLLFRQGVVQILVLFCLLLVSRCCSNEVMPLPQLQWFGEVRDGEGGFHGFWHECVQMQCGRKWCRCWWLPLLLYSGNLSTRTGAETLL